MFPHVHAIGYELFHTFRDWCSEHGLRIVDVERLSDQRLALVGVQPG